MVSFGGQVEHFVPNLACSVWSEYGALQRSDVRVVADPGDVRSGGGLVGVDGQVDRVVAGRVDQMEGVVAGFGEQMKEMVAALRGVDG